MVREKPDKDKYKFLEDAVKRGNLFYYGGKYSDKLVDIIRKYAGVKYCVLASSGSAAIHAALIALNIPPGSEVIVPPITDIGTVIGVIYENLIPVFADIEYGTWNIDPASVKKLITEKTAAIIAVHLAGNPVNMDSLRDAAGENLPIIEDCAQAYGAEYHGKKVGSIGTVGCYSLNAFKHINSGEGGFIITDDYEIFKSAFNAVDKFYDRHNWGLRLKRIAPNYRITELQSAVACAEFRRLENIVRRRNKLGDLFNSLLADIEGIIPHRVPSGGFCSYWFTMFTVKPKEIGKSRDRIISELKKRGVPASVYIEKPLYMEELFKRRSFFPGGIWPAEIIAGKKYRYGEGLCPVAENVLENCIKFPIHESFSENKIRKWAANVREVCKK